MFCILRIKYHSPSARNQSKVESLFAKEAKVLADPCPRESMFEDNGVLLRVLSQSFTEPGKPLTGTALHPARVSTYDAKQNRVRQ